MEPLVYIVIEVAREIIRHEIVKSEERGRKEEREKSDEQKKK